MTPYYQDDNVTIYHGDALEVLPLLPTGSVGAIVADPPYCSGGRQQAATRSDYTMRAEVEGGWFDGDSMGFDSYIWWLRQLGFDLFRLAAPGSHFYCFTDWRMYSAVVTAFETTRWTLKSCVVWDKAKGGAMGSFWRNNHELVPVFSKGNPRPLPDGSYFNVLAATKPQGDEHPTVKPLSVIQRLVSRFGWDGHPRPLHG